MNYGHLPTLSQISALDMQHVRDLINNPMFCPDMWSPQGQSPVSPIIVLNFTGQPPAAHSEAKNNKRKHPDLFIDTSCKRTKLDLPPLFTSPKKQDFLFEELRSPGRFLEEVNLWGECDSFLLSSGTPTHASCYIPLDLLPSPLPQPQPIAVPELAPVESVQEPHIDTPTEDTQLARRGRPRKKADKDESEKILPARKLVCIGKRPRKNKKTLPEDQFITKFSMRKNNKV
jgi:hypothetical protein